MFYPSKGKGEIVGGSLVSINKVNIDMLLPLRIFKFCFQYLVLINCMVYIYLLVWICTLLPFFLVCCEEGILLCAVVGCRSALGSILLSVSWTIQSGCKGYPPCLMLQLVFPDDCGIIIICLGSTFQLMMIVVARVWIVLLVWALYIQNHGENLSWCYDRFLVSLPDQQISRTVLALHKFCNAENA